MISVMKETVSEPERYRAKGCAEEREKEAEWDLEQRVMLHIWLQVACGRTLPVPDLKSEVKRCLRWKLRSGVRVSKLRKAPHECPINVRVVASRAMTGTMTRPQRMVEKTLIFSNAIAKQR